MAWIIVVENKKAPPANVIFLSNAETSILRNGLNLHNKKKLMYNFTTELILSRYVLASVENPTA